jgi:hypothetical protein
MNDEERIRAYMHGRSDVPVPDDLHWPTTGTVPRRRWSISSARAWGRLAVAGLVMAVLVVGVLSGLQMPTGPGRPTTPPTSGSTPSTSQPSEASTSFPSEVAGLPVISVAHAVDLLRSGKLDGQAVAVAGYYQEVNPSCPAPFGYIGPLQGWCRFDAFADTQAGAQLCQPEGSNGMSCHQPTGTYLAPFFMSDTSGNVWTWLTAGATGEPAALVLIGHAGDARQWQCTASTQSECANAFVVDRIAWAAGGDVPLAAPETGDQQSGKLITPKMTLAQAVAAAGFGDNVVAAAAFRAGDIATVDPRWNYAGDNILWLVRSLGQGGPSQGEETRPETVSLVDDATGRLIDSHSLKLAGDYQPARLWQMAIVHGLDCCATNDFAFYSVQSDDGTKVHEGMVSGSRSGDNGSTTFGGSYGSGPPLVLPAGRYSITSWLATYDGGAMGTPRDECSTQVTLRPLDNVTLDADYPAGQACTFRPAPSPSPGS